MTPGARSQAAIELLDTIIAAAREGGAAADTLIARYFAARRYAGSSDRRAVRELVYRAVRRAGEVPATGRAALVAVAHDDAALSATFDGSAHAPLPIDPAEPRAAAGLVPRWLADALGGSDIAADEQAAMIGRAPLDLRVNTLKVDRDTVLATFPGSVPTPHAPHGVRLPTGTAVEREPAWRDGLVEVQDEGSQLVMLATNARPGQTVIDLCAGGGGKTLALAAMMENRGELFACDIDRARLSRLMPRAERAGVTIVATQLLDPGREREQLADWHGRADVVLVDAPCSGTGTWRRNPEARWRLTPARLDRLVASQRGVLATAAALAKPGGSVVYVVCSLLDVEGARQVEGILADQPGWRAESVDLVAGAPHGQGRRLTPAADGTDGFFVARLRAPC